MSIGLSICMKHNAQYKNVLILSVTLKLEMPSKERANVPFPLSQACIKVQNRSALLREIFLVLPLKTFRTKSIRRMLNCRSESTYVCARQNYRRSSLRAKLVNAKRSSVPPRCRPAAFKSPAYRLHLPQALSSFSSSLVSPTPCYFILYRFLSRRPDHDYYS